MKRVSRMAVALMVVALAVAVLHARSRAAPPASAGGGPDATESCDEPWGVCLYEHPDYTGPRVVYSIAPGARQRAVRALPPAFQDNITSIKVGANVAVALFVHKDYGTDASSCAWPDLLLDFSVRRLDDFELNDKLSSLVVMPKALKRALGAWACDLRWEMGGSYSARHTHLFPLPDDSDRAEQRYPELGVCCDLDKNINRVWSDVQEVSVVLYENRTYGGESIEFPGKGYWKNIGPASNLGQWNWSDRAASLVVRWTGGPESAGPARDAGFDTFVHSDTPGGDFTHFEAFNGPVACERACANDPRCRGYTWTPGVMSGQRLGEAVYSEPPECWLKASFGARVPQPGMVSGSRSAAARPDPPAPAKPMTIEYGVNRPGKDFRSFTLNGGAAECQQACATDPACRSFTWVKPGATGPAAGCWLKNGIPAGISDTAAISGYAVGGTPDATPAGDGRQMVLPRGGTLARRTGAGAERTIVVEPGYDRPGSDYSQFATQGDHAACQAACASDLKCRSFTWVKVGAQGACWLKDSVPLAVQNANAVSGVVK